MKPFSMALLGWLFIRHLFAPLLPAEQIDAYVLDSPQRLGGRRHFCCPQPVLRASVVKRPLAFKGEP